MRKVLSCLLCLIAGTAMAQKTFTLASPDGKVQSQIQVGTTLTYDIQVDGRQVLAPSALSMTLTGGTEWGVAPRLAGSKTGTIKQQVASPLTRQATMEDHCNTLTLNFRGGYAVEFRAYDNGVAYRFAIDIEKGKRKTDNSAAQNNPQSSIFNPQSSISGFIPICILPCGWRR